MSETGEIYLIWSHEHGRWWGPDGNGYTRRLSEAGRYTQSDAFWICGGAMPGAHHLRALPELPVRLDDILLLRDRYRGAYHSPDPEPWE